jgi:hypothetical protein
MARKHLSKFAGTDLELSASQIARDASIYLVGEAGVEPATSSV